MIYSKQFIFALLLVAFSYADVYMHNPRGSNNRLIRNRGNDNNNRETQNDERLFDSQDNNNGGYDWHGADGKMSYFEGSTLNLEWTNQHGCGAEFAKTECNVVWQYLCGVDGTVRDGTTTTTIPRDEQQSKEPQYGMHEDYYYYRWCENRHRNMGLFLADQDNDILTEAGTADQQTAIYTRQQPNGNNDGNDHHGFECPEERDYYPYWHKTPWVDIAVLTNDPEAPHPTDPTKTICDYYQEESQNVKSKHRCINTQDPEIGEMYNNQGDCIQDANNEWIEEEAWNSMETTLQAPECIKTASSRQNHLGNVKGDGENHSGLDNAMYNWTIPSVSTIESIFGVGAGSNCVVRLRYNMTSTDYDGWRTDSVQNGDDKSPVTNDPYHDYGWSFVLRLAMDTTQFGRTFEDRSHTFSVVSRPATVQAFTRQGGSAQDQVKRQSNLPVWNEETVAVPADAQIYNLNVVGKRGNLIQVYPAEQYGFRPRIIKMKAGEFIHPQWTGTNAAPKDAEGEGAQSTDRHNMVQIPDLKLNKPSDWESGQMDMFPMEKAWELAFINIYDADGNVNSEVESSTLGVKCPTLTQLENLHDDSGINNYREAIRIDDFNCMKLSGTRTPHFDGGLIQMNSPGTYYYMSTRNNNPGKWTQKGTIVVE